ncbi:hypothetical protein Tco_0134316 [Tanacetum coccineum]
MSPKAVLLNTRLTPLYTVKLVYTAHPKPTVHYARPKTHFYKSAQSTVQRPFYKKPGLTNRHFNHKVNTVRPRVVNTARSYRTSVNTVRPRVVNTARPNRTSVNAARANRFNVVKSSTYWVWRPTKSNGASLAFKRQNYINARGRSKAPRYLSLVVPLTKVGDEAVHKELGDRMERVATTASSLEAEQDSDTILGDVNVQTRFEITSIQSIDPPLSRGYTLGSGEDSMKLIGIDEIFPKFAETHNVVAFLEKPKESAGFAEIIDFLKASSVSYALTVNPLQALVDKKRVIVLESSIRRDLHLEDAEGTDCIPTTTIFEELARMGYEKPSQKLTFYKSFFSPQWKYFIHTITQCLSAKSTAWNEFSCSMASLIICLATNQKFNLSKYILDAMVKHLDGGVKFLLYPCFLQVFNNQQLGNMSTHKKIFVNPFHTKKVFANMRRAGKDFSGRVTPLFETMMVQPVEDIGEDSDNPPDSTPTPIIDQLSSSSQPSKDKSSKKAHRQEEEVPQDEAEHKESVPTPSNDPQPSAKDAQAKEIAALKKRIQKLERSKMTRPTDAEVTLVNEQQNEDLMFDTRVLDDDEVFVDVTSSEKNEQTTKNDSTAGEAVTTAGVEDSVASTIPTTVEETLAQTLMEIKAAKPKAKGIVFHDHEEQVSVSKPTVSATQPSVKDKGKGIMIEPKVHLKRKDQIALDEQIARDNQAKLDAELLEEQKLARKQEDEANIALIES